MTSFIHPLIKKPILFALTGFIVLVGFAYGYSLVFSGRAAYIHFGAMIGSIMVANVFFVIIPAQKAMVKAAREGLPLNPQLGKNALSRSMHNNYFTLPVLFVMISNHFPTTFGYEDPWMVLIIISVGTAGGKRPVVCLGNAGLCCGLIGRCFYFGTSKRSGSL